jgi:hypothetical protein
VGRRGERIESARKRRREVSRVMAALEEARLIRRGKEEGEWLLEIERLQKPASAHPSSLADDL